MSSVGVNVEKNTCSYDQHCHGSGNTAIHLNLLSKSVSCDSIVIKKKGRHAKRHVSLSLTLLTLVSYYLFRPDLRLGSQLSSLAMYCIGLVFIISPLTWGQMVLSCCLAQPLDLQACQETPGYLKL